MRNIIHILLTAFYLLISNSGMAQCPAPVFTASDTVCPLQAINIDNSQSGAVSFLWDFCTGDLDSIPLATALPGISGTLSYPLNMKLVEENGQYYGFFANAFGGNYITRYDFGNSPANTPTAVNLNSDALLGNFTSGIDMIKEGNKWYMFLVAFSGNALLRYEMDSLTQVNPNLTNLNIPGLANPNTIKIINGYGFVTNNQSLEITRLDFGGSYTNTPTVLSPSISTGNFNNHGFDVTFDCASNKYIGYSTCSGVGQVLKLDFGNSLTNLPLITTVATGLPTAQGIQLVKEADKWHLFLVSDNNNFYHFSSGSSLDFPMIQQYSTNFNGIMAAPQNIQMVKIDSDWIGIISNKLLFSIVRIQFPQGCTGTPFFSNAQSPGGISLPASSLGNNIFQLAETLPNGDINLFVDSVFIQIPPPEASFSFSSTCRNTPITFTDNSTLCFGNINGWNWDFGDGNFSNLSTPVHTYATVANFDVKLTVYTDNGDSASVIQTITIHELPQVWFSRPDSACVGSDVQFIDSSSSNDGVLQQWIWSFGDGFNGTGDVSTHAFNIAGIYQTQVTVTTSFGCSDSIIRTIDIQPGPIADFTAFNTCVGETAQFLNLTTAQGTSVISNDWSFGDGNSSNSQNPSHLYIGTASTYNVTLISNSLNGCADTIQKSIRIANQPTPWFILNEDTVCTMSMLQFTDSSVAGAGDTITNRYWDFGDGTIDSTSINPLHFYSLPGVYTITLRVTSPENCDSTIARTVFIIESPQAIFTTSNVCLGEESIFIDSSTSPAGSTINSWQWDFGDGSGATNSNTQHLFTNSGNYTVTLVVSSDIGCFDTTFKQINIYELPSAYFTTGKSCTNLPVQFTDSSTSGSPIIGWEWNFGSGLGISTLQHPTFSFPSALAYNVSLVVTSAENCKDTSDKFIAVEQTPEFTIATTDQCLGSNANFNFIPSPGSSSNLSYLWNFGDSTASFLPNPSHLYSSDGIYAVELSVTDLNNSCVGILKDSVTIFPLPVAGFTNSSACIGAPVSFTDTSQISNGTISNWSWKFSNFGTSALEDPQFTYSSTGTFPVSLLVSSSLGCKDSITKSINVNSIPEVSFQASPNYGAPPLVVQYINNSDNGAYSWTFGDNSSGSNSFSPLHQYNDTGIFQTTLIVVDSNGCKDSSSQFIYVFIPEPDLSINGVSFNKINNLWVLKALISNTGNEDAFRFVLKAELEGATVLYETFDNDTLKAGTMNEYLFKSKFEGTGINPSWFCSEIISINDKPDEIKTNNRFCITTSLKFEVYSVYPSPFENEIYMGINMPVTGEISIHLTDLLGRSCIEERRMLLSEGFNTIQLNTPELQSSIYLLKIVSGDDSKIIRIIKK